jgi:hypothetical protein
MEERQQRNEKLVKRTLWQWRFWSDAQSEVKLSIAKGSLMALQLHQAASARSRERSFQKWVTFVKDGNRLREQRERERLDRLQQGRLLEQQRAERRECRYL